MNQDKLNDLIYLLFSLLQSTRHLKYSDKNGCISNIYEGDHGILFLKWYLARAISWSRVVILSGNKLPIMMFHGCYGFQRSNLSVIVRGDKRTRLHS